MAKAKRKGNAGKQWPILAAAVFCERVLQEKDSVLSLIRVIDTLRIPTDALKASRNRRQPLAFELVLFASFKAGSAKGQYEMTVSVVFPSGRRQRLGGSFSFNFLGGPHGVAASSPIQVPVHASGTYWYELNLDGKTLARMPLQVLHVDRPVQGESAPAASTPKS